MFRSGAPFVRKNSMVRISQDTRLDVARRMEVMGPLTSPPPSPWRWLGHRRLEQEPVKTPALVHLELAVERGWSVNQDTDITTR